MSTNKKFRTELATQKSDLVTAELVLQEMAEKVNFLQAENKKCQTVIKEYENFRETIGQVLHDIQAPLCSLQIFSDSDSSNSIPEKMRIILRSAVINATDITNQALNQFKPQDIAIAENNKRQSILVSTILSEVISDRRYKCTGMPIEFEYNLTNLNAFLFIKAAPSDLKRSISNLIKNAVESLPSAGGKIELKLKANAEWVYISILDNGRGIPDDVMDKIKNSVEVTDGKEDGHGFGLMQVQRMLKENCGKFEIFSSTCQKIHGTTVTLSFPRIPVSDWSIDEINLFPDDTILILDDESSIHDAWNFRFSHIVEKIPSIKIKHFFDGNEVLDYVHGLSVEAKQNVCFLCDYELNKQELNGVEIIEISKIKRSVLVTNYSAELEIRKVAIQNRVKILPKELAHVVSFNISQDAQMAMGKLANVHMVFLDDEKMAMNALVTEYFNHLIVDQYSNPFEFLEEVVNYPKDTKLIIDNYYYAEDGSTYNIDGISIARQLHEKGYTKLFLLSGEKFNTPDYLKLILKSDMDSIRNLYEL